MSEKKVPVLGLPLANRFPHEFPGKVPPLEPCATLCYGGIEVKITLSAIHSMRGECRGFYNDRAEWERTLEAIERQMWSDIGEKPEEHMKLIVD